MMLSRKEIYRCLLKAKGRYQFWYSINLSTHEEVMFDENHPLKKTVSWIQQGDDVIFRCGFGWNCNRGYGWFEEWWRERLFTWNSKKQEFELVEEETHHELME